MDAVLRAKLALESELVTPLSHVLMGYVIAKQEGLGVVGRVPWLHQLGSVLIEHYARVTMVMTGRRPTRPQTAEAAAVNAEHLLSMRQRAEYQSKLILTSIDREWDRTPETKAESTSGLYSKMTGKAKAVWGKIKEKFGAIITGQTNAPAEDTRAAEAKKIAGNKPLFKWWSTLQDDRVRHAHEQAEGQEQPISQAFDVGGERLMFPGDQSLGASLGNVINCRCSAVYFTRNADGSRHELASTPRLTPVAPKPMTGTVNHPSLITRETTLRTGMIERVFLGDMAEARIAIQSGVIRVYRGNQRLATGRYTHGMRSGARVQDLQITPAGEGLGIRELIERSVQLTNRR